MAAHEPYTRLLCCALLALLAVLATVQYIRSRHSTADVKAIRSAKAPLACPTRCANELHFETNGGLGNWMLYALSAATLFERLRCAQSSTAKCIIHVSQFSYGPTVLTALRNALPSLDEVLAPCELLHTPGKQAPRLRNATILEPSRRAEYLSGMTGGAATSLRGELVDGAWRAACKTALGASPGAAAVATPSSLPPSIVVLDGWYNFCGAAGMMRLGEMPPMEYWTQLRQRAERLSSEAAPRERLSSEAAPRDRPAPLKGRAAASGSRNGRAAAAAGRGLADGGPSERTLCLHLRARDVEMGRNGKVESINQRRAGALQAAARLVSELARSGPAAAVSDILVTTPFPHMLRHLQNHSILGKLPLRLNSRADGISDIRHAGGDVLTLSKCSLLVSEEPPSRGTFVLLAMLIGGLHVCPKAASAIGAPAWHVLCRDDMRLASALQGDSAVLPRHRNSSIAASSSRACQGIGVT